MQKSNLQMRRKQIYSLKSAGISVHGRGAKRWAWELCEKEDGRGVEKMFRLWGKIWKDNHMLKDTVICDDSEDTRTHKVFRALEEICYEFDLSKPIWLDKTIEEFKRHDKARFYQDNFMEEIPFDYLELHVIEED